MVYYDNIRIQGELAMKRAYSQPYDHDCHIHQMLEICVIVEHSAVYRFNSVDYEANPGDVFICKPFDAHWIFSKDPRRPCQYILIYFEPSIVNKVPQGNLLLTPFYMTDREPRIPASSRFAQEAARAAMTSVQEREAGLATWKSRQFMHLINMLSYLYEYTMEHDSELEAIEEGLISAIHYFVAQSNDSIDIEEAVRLSGLSRTKFFRCFRIVTGLSPHQFLTRTRLQAAAHAIIHSSQSILNISMEAGFSSLSTFNKRFVNHFGLAPREYRKQYQPLRG
ncbi:helix-turn-helix transcriptional regulator [Paenibacillus sacheonensis]|uniref:Helix-turn-helix domain-containing protein n=1 Tax=Paenibacillus sacheonensis TaxID=742054 RepID=A0A7X4YWL2_9BACL|nr:AraC family transcriptional regulator [Paenibacillus sacheonensis]MBM7568062.1 AraC-like DNA-binding protein [Paenibacillus sacheonensis]NBC72909.1 helix-turn-helix domain-containing protein [Paenibacillus sacheonensis]